MVIAAVFSSVLFLISNTFLWEFECNDGMNVGLAAGRYSGKSLPDLYRTPQALQSVFGPIGPARHCGVLVISQCIHFLTDCDDGKFWFPAPPSNGGASEKDNLIFLFLIFCVPDPAPCFGNLTKGRDSAKLSVSDAAFGTSCNAWSGVVVSVTEEAGEIRWIIGDRGLKVAGRGRLLRARPRCWPGVATVGSGLRGCRVLSLEQELLLSRTETGLEVWNWLLLCVKSLTSSLFIVRPSPQNESSTKFASQSNWTMSSYCKQQTNYSLTHLIKLLSSWINSYSPMVWQYIVCINQPSVHVKMIIIPK